MATESGAKMQKAINAVCRMHASVSKMLLDFDRQVPWPTVSVFGNFATRDLTYNAKASFWMPEGVFRYLSSKADPALVEAICICFVSPRLEEPVLLVGELRYNVSDATQLKAACEGWDLWYLYFEWNKDWEDRVPRDCDIPTKAASRLVSGRMSATPLYSVVSMNDVADLLTQLREKTR